MPRGKWIDKKTAQHFTLVHRPQNDPLIHDENAPAMVLNPIQPVPGSKVKHLDDLASELGSETESIRENEGEAASYGVFFDDSEYDYMQHLRDLGSGGGGDVVFVESTATLNKGKGKQKQSLEDALKQMDLEQKSGELLDEEMLPSKNLTRLTYQAQQDVPDAIAGFNPDMDPRLREVLEALEDDAYVDDDEDVFNQLSKDGQELDDYEFEETAYGEYEDEDDGWESDHTAKPTKEYKEDEVPELVTAQAEDGPSEDWMEEFKQFKKDQKGGVKKGPVVLAQSESQSQWTTTTHGGRTKKRKGARTEASSYSMTSSSLVRTEQLGLLDARFEKLEARYNDEFDDMASMSEVSTASSVQGPLRGDFDGILDDFLGNYTKPGKRTSKKTKAQTGLEQLDEIRRGLGPARIRGRT
ncbi:Protein LTV1 [Cladobotryum mycophilum]|uniref:Protein LTV1 n=1 Tax=Cladobotryum mycophilum TaxID=491253 RepID=A0ABR0SMI7_9HYPO